MASALRCAVVKSTYAPVRPPTNESWSGAVSGAVSRSYDNDFRTSSISVDAAEPVGFQYDDDGLVTKGGDLTLVRDPQTGRRVTLTVIGVLSDATPTLMSGIWTSQGTLAPVFGDRVLPTTHLIALRPGVDAAATAKRLESTFLANGMQADSLKKLLADVMAASLTFDRLIMGFMGLGLVVGVAALGVITARAVVERRQQIGVLGRSASGGEWCS